MQFILVTVKCFLPCWSGNMHLSLSVVTLGDIWAQLVANLMTCSRRRTPSLLRTRKTLLDFSCRPFHQSSLIVSIPVWPGPQPASQNPVNALLRTWLCPDNNPLKTITGLSLAPGCGRRKQRLCCSSHAMMQISESYNQKKSLFSAMNRFIFAVNNMDQTVMVPNLLRDVPLDDTHNFKTTNSNNTAYFHQDSDMYSSYVLLKSIRNDIEWGVLQGEERRREKGGGMEPSWPKAEEDDLEKQLHFHLNGLHAVLSKLTRKADTLTSRYKEEIGCRNWDRMCLYFTSSKQKKLFFSVCQFGFKPCARFGSLI